MLTTENARRNALMPATCCLRCRRALHIRSASSSCLCQLLGVATVLG